MRFQDNRDSRDRNRIDNSWNGYESNRYQERDWYRDQDRDQYRDQDRDQYRDQDRDRYDDRDRQETMVYINSPEMRYNFVSGSSSSNDVSAVRFDLRDAKFSKRDDRPGSGRDRLQGNGRRPGRMEEGGRPPIQLDAREGKELFAHIQSDLEAQLDVILEDIVDNIRNSYSRKRRDLSTMSEPGEESLASAEFEHTRIRRELGQRRIKREPFEIFLNIFRFRKHGESKPRRVKRDTYNEEPVDRSREKREMYYEEPEQRSLRGRPPRRRQGSSFEDRIAERMANRRSNKSKNRPGRRGSTGRKCSCKN